jgi:hypothetical protein
MNHRGELLPTTYRFKIDTAPAPNSTLEILFSHGNESIEPSAMLYFEIDSVSIATVAEMRQAAERQGLRDHIDHDAAYRRAQPTCRLTRPAASVKQQLCNAAVTSFDLAARRPNRTPSLLVLVPGPPGLPHAQLR